MLRDSRPRLVPERVGRRARWFGRRLNRKVRAVERPKLRLGDYGRTLGRIALCMSLGAGLVGAGVALRYVLLHGDRFALREVRFTQLHHLDAQKIIADSGLELGQSLFAIDTKSLERKIGKTPWVANVRVRRELPHTVAIEIVEREAKIGVAFGALYLVDERGDLFKRASGDEPSGLTIVTGVDRERYAADPHSTRAILRRAIELDHAWRESGTRAPLGELHHESGRDAAATFTGYFTHAGKPVAVRIGTADSTTSERLRRLDAVLASLDRSKQRPALIHLDQQVVMDRIAVRLFNNGGAPEAAPQAL